ncbi:MAG: matrixin family metalloprotease [Lysobacter sp.]|nr:matrixin family metalloprotease [Lysobacter sp.]
MATRSGKKRFGILLLVLAMIVVGQRISWDRGALSWRPFGQPRHTFAHVPCGIPIHIALDEVDPRFGFQRATVLQALKEAVDLWQAAGDAKMFVWSDHPQAMAINLEFDERQHNVNQQRSLRGGIDRDRWQLQSHEVTLKQWGGRIEAARRDHDRQSEAFARRARAHQAEVAAWNSANPQARTEPRRQALERESLAVRAMQAKVQRGLAELNADIASYNRRAREQQQQAEQYRGRVARYNTLSSPQPIESGRYSYDREQGRRIAVFRTGDYNDLVWIFAHELGHSLGLDHLNQPGAVMNELLHDGDGVRGPVRPVALSSADRNSVFALCSGRLQRI